MKQHYPHGAVRIVRIFVLFFLSFLSTQAFSQSSVCGPIAESFDNGAAGFTSTIENTNVPGFVWNGQTAALQACGVPSGGTVYEIVTPTFQSFASQTSVGFGFQLAGWVSVSNVAVKLQYNHATTGAINTVLVGHFTPAYTGVGGSSSATLCHSVAMSNFAGFQAGGKYRFILQLTATSSSDASECITFDNFRTTGAASQIPLPVSFTGVNLRQTNSAVELQWNVAGEREVIRYEVERSVDGRQFMVAGQVGAVGNTAYRFTDVQPAKGTSYYRVKSVDADGSIRYSVTLRHNGAAKTGTLQLYPNPVQAEVVVGHGKLTTGARISIIGADGRVAQTHVPNPHFTNSSLQLGGLKPGVYILQLDNGTGSIMTTTFVKQ